MSTSKMIAVLAASALVGLFSVSAQAESIPQMEAEQFSGSSNPDVDAGASRGADRSIVEQEQNQFGNDPAPDLGPERQSDGGEDLPEMEQQGIPGGDR
ncbi:hypothetical protein [Hyphomicrobium sp. D-2]|uniref:hypothetical protein n=1 Tax=Hyphomicrobium sp. D-2 TaxID=3041621 RepID=UPI0024545813|nr:hypothetical protein [Hyphomicrobium sp. D-2]MDH4982222.1 hypothetical protein [Hyphomicrobium sp. D-2]